MRSFVPAPALHIPHGPGLHYLINDRVHSTQRQQTTGPNLRLPVCNEPAQCMLAASVRIWPRHRTNGTTMHRSGPCTLHSAMQTALSHAHCTQRTPTYRLYTLRIAAQGSQRGAPKEHAVLFSMPAACFAAALAGAHRVDLHLSPAGWLTGLEVRHHPDLDCAAPAQVQFPASTDAKALFASPGVTMSTDSPDGARQRSWL